MILEHKYSLRSDDFLKLLLYKYSKNKAQQKQYKFRYIKSGIFVSLMLYILYNTLSFDNNVFLISIPVFITYYLLDYLFLLKKRIKKQYENYLYNSSSSKFNVEINLKIDNDAIIFSDYTGNTSLFLNAIESIVLLNNLIIITSKTDNQNIIKGNQEIIDDFILHFEKNNISVIDNSNWKW
ncbi:MAG: hypothetical protein ACPGVH_08190 [Chitinophagales bacterium]